MNLFIALLNVPKLLRWLSSHSLLPLCPLVFLSFVILRFLPSLIFLIFSGGTVEVGFVFHKLAWSELTLAY